MTALCTRGRCICGECRTRLSSGWSASLRGTPFSVEAVAVRELAEASRRADNPILPGQLLDLDITADSIVAESAPRGRVDDHRPARQMFAAEPLSMPQAAGAKSQYTRHGASSPPEMIGPQEANACLTMWRCLDVARCPLVGLLGPVWELHDNFSARDTRYVALAGDFSHCGRPVQALARPLPGRHHGDTQLIDPGGLSSASAASTAQLAPVLWIKAALRRRSGRGSGPFTGALFAKRAPATDPSDTVSQVPFRMELGTTILTSAVGDWGSR